MVERILSVLVVEGSLTAAEKSAGSTAPARKTNPFGNPAASKLQLLPVAGLDEAVALMRHRRIDAILVGQSEAGGIAWLHACAADLPILMIADERDLEAARLAIGAGAEDVLLPADLKGRTLRRRIELAIARKANERQRLRSAREDLLTGLANGTLLEERFNRALARADRFATLVGLVAIDIDGFDQLIGEHGQSAADYVLSTIGQRLLGETRQTDTLARTRDHGFTWLVEGLPAIDDISALVNRLPDHLARPLKVRQEKLHVTASVGVAIYPCHGRDFQTVHGMAEAAMTDVSSISGDSLLMLPIPAASERQPLSV